MQINHFFANPSSAEIVIDLIAAQQEHQRCKNAAHFRSRNSLSQRAARDSTQKYSGNQQQSGLPGNVTGLPIAQNRQNSSGRNQGDQAGPLRAMLTEPQQQSQNWHHNHSAANAEQSRRDASDDSRKQHPAVQ